MKMTYESMVCEVAVVEDLTYITRVHCEYQRDVIAYAVKQFFAHCKPICKECTKASFKLRVAKGKKARRPKGFVYMVPAILMELPGEWVKISGTIDEVGVLVRRVEILQEHPSFNVEFKKVS
ncbi:hypothetical protein P261_00741 [Lachnospiraceae bacterium TWA4]|nr:hypothetical protein P261_00741 [Lachnospiraceae bacterium TWA4]